MHNKNSQKYREHFSRKKRASTTYYCKLILIAEKLKDFSLKLQMKQIYPFLPLLLNMILEAWSIEGKNGQKFIEIKNFTSEKLSSDEKIMYKQEKINLWTTYTKMVVMRMYYKKNSPNSTFKKLTIQFKNGQKTEETM